MRRFLPLWAALTSLALLVIVGPVTATDVPAYVAVGDSLAFGVGASDPAGGGYVAVAHDALRRSDRYRDRGLDLVNLGVPGATSSDLLLPGGQLERALNEISDREEDGSSTGNVEIITIGIGANDALSLATPDSPCVADPVSAECQDRVLEMLDTLEENLTEVMSRLRDAAPEAEIVVLDLYSPLSGRGGAADQITDFAIEEINAVTERVVSSPDLRADLAMIYRLFRGRAAEFVAADDVHLNDDGHALTAEVVLATIEGREPILPEDMMAPDVAEGMSAPSQGVGGLQLPAREDDEDTNLALLLAIAIPASLLGIAAIAGAYRAARGR
jgi:lysophospholipase L1-like esterase